LHANDISLHRALIGLGSNLGDRVAQLENAIAALGELGTVSRRSALYRTKPWGKADQPDFVNAAILLETRYSPRELLHGLKVLETRLGREPGERWGPRSIDLDLLAYDDVTIDEPDLHVPHARLRERAFVLVPLAEIDSRYERLRDALDRSELAAIERIDEKGIL
jgi:2-amino-4-hydroxy-6-hydroxymethyldihydropteridine diphosphokinase